MVKHLWTNEELITLGAELETVFHTVFRLVYDFSEQLSWITIDPAKLEETFELFDYLDPTASSFANRVRKLHVIIESFSDFLPSDYSFENSRLNAAQCVVYLDTLAKSIELRDLEGLETSIKRLQSLKRP